MRLLLALTLLASVSSEWRAGAFHGVVTGESDFDVAGLAFGATITAVLQGQRGGTWSHLDR